MEGSEIGRRRLMSQRIAGQRLEQPEDVVTRLGAMQAQDYSQVLWAIGLRMTSPSLTAVEEAIADGRILRTWPMRGTIHFVPACDARWMVRLLAPRRLAGDALRMRQLELDVATINRCGDLFAAALTGGRALTRAEMMELLEAVGISTKGQRGYHILWRLAQNGLICLGPMRQKQQTFVLLDEWALNPVDLIEDEALAELARRYAIGHGPVTARDFSWWAGLTLTHAKRGLEAAASDLVQETLDEGVYWSGPAGSAPNPGEEPGGYLLPGFDEFLLGYQGRDAVLPRAYANQVVPGGNGVFFPMVVLNGRIVGTWKRTLRKDSVDITLSPFVESFDFGDTLDRPQASYSQFVGLLPGNAAVCD